jgi:hypothetical protein
MQTLSQNDFGLAQNFYTIIITVSLFLNLYENFNILFTIL